MLRDGAQLRPDDFVTFLAAQPDLSPTAWPRYLGIDADLPTTATNKILKRALTAAGTSAEGGVLWARRTRGTAYGQLTVSP
ncbi:hypothetical protein A5695_09880 [Mycobacterium sp. E1747]|nr:hypothetical protein A5695_09880 [Mycobacterium sp. E1747]